MDPVAGLIFGVVDAILVPAFLVPGVLFVLYKLRAMLARTLAAVLAAASTTVSCFGSYTAQVLTLARPVDLGLFAVMAVVACMCGTSFAEQLHPQVLGLLAAGLRFAGLPVTAPLGLLAAFVEASAGVLWGGLAHLLSLSLLDALCYLIFYVLPPQLILKVNARVCALQGGLVAATDSIIQRRLEGHVVDSVCGLVQMSTEAKAILRADPARSLWLDLLLLVWFGFVCWCMWRCFKSSTSVPAAASSVRTKERQRLEAARQRKEAKAAERKMIRQLMRQGAL